MKRYDFYFILVMIVNVSILLIMVNETSIYYKEAILVEKNNEFAGFLANISLSFFHLFSKDYLLNDFFARAPFILFHILNCILLYLISLQILRKKSHVIFCVILFVSVPGVSIQSLLISKAVVITFISLLISYIHLKWNQIAYPLFVVAIFLDQSSSILFLALFFYSLINHKNIALVFAMLCFALNMYIFSPIRGVPYAYFLDTVGIMALLFSPIFFIYYCYAIYSSSFHKNVKLINLIPLIGIIFTLLLSIRQEINLESFIPVIIIGIPFLVLKLMSDLNIRLSKFRGVYRSRIAAIILFLVFENLILFGNKITYLFSPHLNFAYSFYGAKEIAINLGRMGIDQIFVDDSNLSIRLKFYGIDTSDEIRLTPAYHGDFDIRFLGVNIASYKVTKY